MVAVIEGSLAAKAGIEDADRLLKIQDRELESVADLQEALVAARDEGLEMLSVALLRGDEQLELKVAFDVQREAAP